MKTNYPLQTSIGARNPGQKVWYAAHVLRSALRNSPAVLIRAAVTAAPAKPAVIAQTAKPLRVATPAIPGSENTMGYGFGELYLNSPAYPIGTAIPAIPAKAASLAVIGKEATLAVTPVSAITSPAVVAIKGWEDAVTILKTATELTVIAELPVLTGVGLVGSPKIVIGEITPSTLQANAWVSEIAYSLGEANPDTILAPTLEQYLYNHALECDHLVTDVTRIIDGVSIPCKRVVVTLYHSSGYYFDTVDIQLPRIHSVSTNLAS
jgi:hypothetical protein